MRYNLKLGVFGNIEKLYTEATLTNNTIFQNKIDTDQKHYATEDALCEIDPTQKVEDIETATLELDERLIALEEKIKLLENK